MGSRMAAHRGLWGEAAGRTSGRRPAAAASCASAVSLHRATIAIANSVYASRQSRERNMTELTRRSVLAGAAVASAATALTPLAPTPAKAAAPLLGTQAPGWYRYKVGSHEITCVTDGRNTFKFPDNFVMNVKKD